jgi:signal transduction histidine kinase/CheY-like chemotaxis protein/predicted secreted protein
MARSAKAPTKRKNRTAPSSSSTGNKLVDERVASAAAKAFNESLPVNEPLSLAASAEPAPDRHILVSTLPAGPRQRRVALVTVIVSTLIFFLTLPFVRLAWPQIPAFIPTYEAALAINDLVTAVLLFGQFATLRARALLALACGYLFGALSMIPHALSFPGSFAATGLLGAGTQTTAWLYVFWHGGFALFVLAYGVLGARANATIDMPPRRAIAAAIVTVVALAAGLTALATIGHDLLPVIINGTDFSLLVEKGVSPGVWLLSFAALLVLLRRAKPTVLDLWVMVVLTAWLYDVALSAVVNSHRFDLGFYAGRFYGLLASSFVLIVLLAETGGLHRRLALANARLERHGHELEDQVRAGTVEMARSQEALHAEMAERKQAEARLIHAQKMEAIGNLTGGLAHDFNNLLGVVVGNLDMLRDQTKEKPEMDELVGDALDAALRGSELTHRLLAFARRQSLRPVRVDVNELVEGVTKLLTRTLGAQVEITVELEPELCPALADPAQLEAAILNLANNARDAMPKGGHLTIRTRNHKLDEDYASTHPETAAGDYAMIEVTDTGTGMTPEVTARIFEPFFTTKEHGKGTGLGLSMVFGFIKQSGGHINVYSEVGIGTTFRLFLPRDTAPGAVVKSAEADPIPQGGGQTILIVEDHPGLRRLVIRQVLELGYRFLEADNAVTALSVLERQRVDVLLTDIVMPGQINGLDLARTASKRWPRMRVVLTSGFPTKIGGSLGREANLLIKPYRKIDLARVLTQAIAK